MHRPLRGRQPRAALLMVGSMAFFAVEDLFLKRAAEALPPGQVLALTGAAGALVFWAAGGAAAATACCRWRPCAACRCCATLAEAGAAMLYIVALALAPLTMTSALLQASPLVVVAGAALFLGEKVGLAALGLDRGRVCRGAGDPGALGRRISIRPALLTVACVLVLAVRDLATRVMPARIGDVSGGGLGLSGAGACGGAADGGDGAGVRAGRRRAQWAGPGGAR